jgi:hypothetical protein
MELHLAARPVDAGHDALTLPSEPNVAPAVVLPNAFCDGPSLAGTLAAHAPGSAAPRRLAPRTLGAVPVNVVQVTGVLGRPALRLTLYIDRATGVLRGFDAAGTDPSYAAPSWQVRLQSYAAMRASSAPAGAFALDVPGDARVAANPDKAALRAACGDAKVGGTSLIDACRAHDPSLDADRLADALGAASIAALDRASAAGVLTPAAAAAAKQRLHAQLVAFVTARR